MLLAAIVGQLVFFSTVGDHRFIDGDEGAFLVAARLVLAHKTPYVDFFYQQAPLLPYVYAAFMKVGGVSWPAARNFCALLATILGTLLCIIVWSLARSSLAAACSVALFTSSTLVFAWFPVVKTHCLAALFLFCAYALLGEASLSKWTTWASGIFLGLGVDTRSYLLLVVPVFLWWIIRNNDRTNRPRASITFLIGVAVGLLPALWLFLRSPDAFIFNNLQYHALRFGDAGLIGWWQEKIFIAVQLFLGSAEANGLQWSIVFFVGLGFLSTLPRKSPARFAFYIAVVLAVVCLLPTPSYLQYFSVCMPLLIVTAVSGSTNLFRSLDLRRDRLLFAGGALIALAAYTGLGLHDLRKYVVTGDGVPGVYAARDRADWRIDRVVKVSEAVDRITQPGEVVASFWSGDIFQSHALPEPGLENPFAITVADKLTAAQRTKYHIATWQDIETNFASGQPRVVVLRSQISSAFPRHEFPEVEQRAQRLATLLTAQGYALVTSSGDISIYSLHR